MMRELYGLDFPLAGNFHLLKKVIFVCVCVLLLVPITITNFPILIAIQFLISYSNTNLYQFIYWHVELIQRLLIMQLQLQTFGTLVWFKRMYLFILKNPIKI